MMTGGHWERLPLVTLVAWATASIGGSKCSLIPSPRITVCERAASSAAQAHLNMDQQLSFLVHRNLDRKKSCRFHGYQHIDLMISTREREIRSLLMNPLTLPILSCFAPSFIHTFLIMLACSPSLINTKR